MDRSTDVAHQRDRTSESPNWREAWLRGAVLGLVFGFHGLLLLAFLHLSGWQSIPSTARTSENVAMRLRLIAALAPLQTPNTPTPARRDVRKPRAIHAVPRTSTNTRMSVEITAPHQKAPAAVPALASSDYQPYHAGGFRQALQDAQSGSPVRLPGSDAHIVQGIQLKPVVSMRDAVHALAQASLCSAESFKMQRQALPPEEVDRLLEADGCGAHTGNSPAVDASIQRATQQATGQALFGQ